MSLVQEALRRKQGEEQGLPLPVAAPVAESQALTPSADPESSGLVKGLRMACYVVIVLGALAGLYSLFRPSTKEVVREVPIPAPAVPVTAEPTTPEPAQPVDSEPVVKPVRAPVTTPAPAPEVVGEWPELRVMGVFAQPDPSKSTVVIDGDIEELNAVIQGVRVVEIRANGVLVRRGGEEKFVRVGHTTLR